MANTKTDTAVWNAVDTISGNDIARAVSSDPEAAPLEAKRLKRKSTTHQIRSDDDPPVAGYLCQPTAFLIVCEMREASPLRVAQEGVRIFV
jgi:hypothetical protein